MKRMTILLMLFCCRVFAGDIIVKDEMIRLMPPSSPVTGAFMEIINSSNKNIKLIKAKSTYAKKTEIHNHIKVDGVMKMREVPFIEIPAKSSVLLKPGSYHIMFFELSKPLVLDETIKVELEFDNNETLVIEPKVKDM